MKAFWGDNECYGVDLRSVGGMWKIVRDESFAFVCVLLHSCLILNKVLVQD